MCEQPSHRSGAQAASTRLESLDYAQLWIDIGERWAKDKHLTCSTHWTPSRTQRAQGKILGHLTCHTLIPALLPITPAHAALDTGEARCRGGLA
jgi:hypothetical protein